MIQFHDLVSKATLLIAHPSIWRGTDPTDVLTRCTAFFNVGPYPTCSFYLRPGDVPWTICVTFSPSEDPQAVVCSIRYKTDLKADWYNLMTHEARGSDFVQTFPYDLLDKMLDQVDQEIIQREIHVTNSEDC
jgi:hypothetical protein